MTINAFAIAPSQNTDGSDASGAFIPGAQKFASAYNCSYRLFNNVGTHAAIRRQFYDTIRTYCPQGINLFAYFGHGIHSTFKGLSSAKVYLAQLDDFYAVLEPKIRRPFVAVLYACSVGSPGGFSGKLREKLGYSAKVVGHTTVAHAFCNPNVSVESTSSSPSFRLLYHRGSPLRSAWADALQWTDLWVRFPLMSIPAIDREANVRRLIGKWRVRIGGTTRQYEFETKYRVWTVNSGRAIDAIPTGTAKVFNNRTLLGRGTWAMKDQLIINWDTGSRESWELPLKVTGQHGTAGSSTLTAARLSRPSNLGTRQR